MADGAQGSRTEAISSEERARSSLSENMLESLGATAIKIEALYDQPAREDPLPAADCREHARSRLPPVRGAVSDQGIGTRAWGQKPHGGRRSDLCDAARFRLSARGLAATPGQESRREADRGGLGSRRTQGGGTTTAVPGDQCRHGATRHEVVPRFPVEPGARGVRRLGRFRRDREPGPCIDDATERQPDLHHVQQDPGERTRPCEVARRNHAEAAGCRRGVAQSRSIDGRVGGTAGGNPRACDCGRRLLDRRYRPHLRGREVHGQPVADLRAGKPA